MLVEEQIQDFDHGSLEVQQFIPSPQNNEGMLPLRPSSTTRMNVFGKVWTTCRSLDSSGTSSKGQTPRFNTPRFVQGSRIIG